MKVTIRKSLDLEQYALLEFKGFFESANQQQPCKEHIRLGEIIKVSEDKYLLQVGIMDLVGTPVPLKGKIAITQTFDEEGTQDKIIMIKGFAKLKLQFHRRPIPMMGRSQAKLSDIQKIFGKIK